MNENRCVCCNKIIPEGRQVCWSCENGNIQYDANDLSDNMSFCIMCGKEIPRPKLFFGGRAYGKTMMEFQYNMRQLCCSKECFDKCIDEIRSELNEQN